MWGRKCRGPVGVKLGRGRQRGTRKDGLNSVTHCFRICPLIVYV